MSVTPVSVRARRPGTLLRLALLAVLLACAACAGQPPAPRDVDPKAAAFMRGVQETYEQGQYRLTLALTDSVARHDSTLPELYFFRGLVYTELSGLDQARAAFEKVLSLDPGYPGAWYKVAHTAFLQGKYEDAIRLYRKEQAMLEKPTRQARAYPGRAEALPTVLLQIGRTYDLLGKADSARLSYQASLARDAKSATAHAWLSELDEDEGKLEDALAHARAAVELAPEEIEYRHMAGSLLFQLGRYDEAAAELEQVVRRQPAHTGANYKLGQSLLRSGRADAAKPYLAQAEVLQQLEQQVSEAQATAYRFPEDPEKWVALAGLLVTSGRYQEAMSAFNVARYLRPRSLALHNDIANLTLAMGDTTGAILRYQQLLSIDSTFADGWLNLGVAYALSGERNAARRAWQQALHFDPRHPEARAYLARLDP